MLNDAFIIAFGSGGGGGMENPMTTAGDLILGGASGTPTRLPIGTNGQVLTSDGTTAAWADPSGGGGHLYQHDIKLYRSTSTREEFVCFTLFTDSIDSLKTNYAFWDLIVSRGYNSISHPYPATGFVKLSTGTGPVFGVFIDSSNLFNILLISPATGTAGTVTSYSMTVEETIVQIM